MINLPSSKTLILILKTPRKEQLHYAANTANLCIFHVHAPTLMKMVVDMMCFFTLIFTGEAESPNLRLLFKTNFWPSNSLLNCRDPLFNLLDTKRDCGPNEICYTSLHIYISHSLNLYLFFSSCFYSFTGVVWWEEAFTGSSQLLNLV